MQQSPCRISVVLATYNGAAFLPQQLQSLQQQTLAIDELIVVDDASTDATIALLEAAQQQWPAMKVVRNSSNQGYLRTFERGLQLATGDVIAFCDQDDIWEHRKLEVLLQAWQPEADLIFCDSYLMQADGTPIGKRISNLKNLQHYYRPEPFIIGNVVSGHAAIIRRRLLPFILPFPEHIIHDWWIAFVAAARGGVQYVDEPLVGYRQHAGSVIGAVRQGGARPKKKTRAEKNQLIRHRIGIFRKALHPNTPAYDLLIQMEESYSCFTPIANFRRTRLFLQNRKLLLATKRRTPLRQFLFCMKLFFKLV